MEKLCLWYNNSNGAWEKDPDKASAFKEQVEDSPEWVESSKTPNL